MSQDIREFVRHLPVIDVHEHHIPEIFQNRNVGLVQLLHQSYAGWTRERPYPLPSEVRGEDPMLSSYGKGSWKDITQFVEESGSSMFVRNMVWSLSELYHLGSRGITRENWSELDDEIRQRHADPRWPREIMRRARVVRVITDPYTVPLLDAQSTLGDDYNSVLRINALAFGWHPDSRDHNDNSAWEFADQLGIKLECFEDYENFLEHLVVTMSKRHQVALKNALAYDRDLGFEKPDEKLAKKTWGKSDPTPGERKAFGDFVVDRMCTLAAVHEVPVQMHLGTAIIRGSHPLNVAGLIERHPSTRFLLMHLAYPWSQDLLGMAFVYRNIWLDLTWSFLLSPTHFKRAFHEAIEVLPDESRMMLGGDNWHAEETFGTFAIARKLIGDVLFEKVEDGYFGHDDACRLARKIFHENAECFFQLRQTQQQSIPFTI